MLLQDSFVQSFAKPISGKTDSIIHVEKSQPVRRRRKIIIISGWENCNQINLSFDEITFSMQLIIQLLFLFQMLTKKFYRALPGKFSGFFIITCWRRIVMKSMVGIFINIKLIMHPSFF